MRKLWVAGIAVALTSCSAADDMGAAGSEVEAFHRAYDAGRYGMLWEKSASAMKEVTTKQQFVDLMATLRERLGPIEGTSRTGFNVNYATGGSEVTLTYQTTYANGEGTETFLYDTETPPRLLGWHINSPALLAPATAQ